MPGNSVVSKHWREFERLSLEMIESQLALKPDLVHLTQESKDGGYDGEILHELAQFENVRIQHRTLLEAKLRSDEGSLGLRAFAATIVIAFNVAAQTLVVVSNRPFSMQALQQAACFCWKTNMQIHLVDGPTLGRWIRREFQRLSAAYPRELLDFLTLHDPGTEQVQRIEIVPAAGALPFGTQGGGAPIPAFIELGWRSEREIAPCRIELDGQSDPSGQPPRNSHSLIGKRRERLARDLAIALSARPGVAVLYGQAGAGKSVVAEAVRHDLRARGIPTSVVDLTTVHGTRQLFVRVLSELSGIDILAAVEADAREESLRALFSRVAGAPITPEIQAALVAVFQRSYEQHQARRDLDFNLLLAFLRNAVTPYTARRRSVLVFENLNRGTPEILEFLHALVSSLARAGVGVLVELRDAEEAAVVSPREWEAFVRLFRLTAELGEFTVHPLDDEEADAYLAEFLPGMGTERLAVIRRRVGCLPLFLRAAALWLRDHEVVRGNEGFLLVEDLEVFFEGIRPGEAVVVLDRLVESRWERADFPFADCISAAVLFDGVVGSRVLEALFPDQDTAAMLERLRRSGLFVPALNQPGAVTPAHDLMLERMQEIALQRPFRMARVAERLLPVLPDVEPDPLVRGMRTARGLSAVARWAEAHGAAMEVADELRGARQWAEAATFYGLADEAASRLSPSVQGAAGRIRALTALLEVEQERERITLEANLRRLDTLKLLLRTTPAAARAADQDGLALRALLLEWRAEFVRERFTPALEVARRASRHARREAKGADPELRGAAFSCYGITLKATDRRPASARLFERAMRIVPESLILQTEHLSNIGALALKDDPQKALECDLEILRLVEGRPYPLSLQLHVLVDVAMALFLAGRYPEALSQARQALQMASANAVPSQEARARNIIGCCLWTLSGPEEADREFDLACLASERMLSHRFLWRMRCNRAGTAAEMGRRDAALACARSAEDLILQPRQESLHRVAASPGYWTLRWYVALLALATWYQRSGSPGDVERLLARVALPAFGDHARAVLSGTYPAEVFESTTHVHAGRVMVTG